MFANWRWISMCKGTGLGGFGAGADAAASLPEHLLLHTVSGPHQNLFGDKDICDDA